MVCALYNHLHDSWALCLNMLQGILKTMTQHFYLSFFPVCLFCLSENVPFAWHAYISFKAIFPFNMGTTDFVDLYIDGLPPCLQCKCVL
jgi:hypothetical protein